MHRLNESRFISRGQWNTTENNRANLWGTLDWFFFRYIIFFPVWWPHCVILIIKWFWRFIHDLYRNFVNLTQSQFQKCLFFNPHHFMNVWVCLWLFSLTIFRQPVEKRSLSVILKGQWKKDSPQQTYRFSDISNSFFFSLFI